LNALDEQSALAKSERLLLKDFLELVDQWFTELNPYTSFEVCRTHIALAQKRARAIVQQLNPNLEINSSHDRNGLVLSEGAAQRVAFSAFPEEDESWSVRLELWPGDTSAQAKLF